MNEYLFLVAITAMERNILTSSHVMRCQQDTMVTREFKSNDKVSVESNKKHGLPKK